MKCYIRYAGLRMYWESIATGSVENYESFIAGDTSGFQSKEIPITTNPKP